MLFCWVWLWHNLKWIKRYSGSTVYRWMTNSAFIFRKKRTTQAIWSPVWFFCIPIFYERYYFFITFPIVWFSKAQENQGFQGLLNDKMSTQTRKFEINSIQFCIGGLVLFGFIFVQLSQPYRLYRMVLSYCYPLFVIKISHSFNKLS